MWAVEIEEDRVDADCDSESEVSLYAHTTVLKDEAVAFLASKPKGTFVDATLGGGGHAEALLEAVQDCTVIGIDRDENALQAASERLSRFGQRVRLLHGPFGDIDRLLAEAALAPVDGILADLGISSAQLADPERGMSFRADGPLDMRMDRSAGETAFDLIQRLDQDELANVIYRYGEERRSRRVARCIKLALADDRLHTTLDLRRAVVRAVGPARVGGVDPATRTFQALRIAVNSELEQLAKLLDVAPTLLVPSGVLVIISFHSLEERMAKRAFQNREVWDPLTKKPLCAGTEELSSNPRARSAKLRAARLAEPSDSFELDGDAEVVL